MYCVVLVLLAQKPRYSPVLHTGQLQHLFTPLIWWLPERNLFTVVGFQSHSNLLPQNQNRRLRRWWKPTHTPLPFDNHMDFSTWKVLSFIVTIIGILILIHCWLHCTELLYLPDYNVEYADASFCSSPFVLAGGAINTVLVAHVYGVSCCNMVVSD